MHVNIVWESCHRLFVMVSLFLRCIDSINAINKMTINYMHKTLINCNFNECLSIWFPSIVSLSLTHSVCLSVFSIFFLRAQCYYIKFCHYFIPLILNHYWWFRWWCPYFIPFLHPFFQQHFNFNFIEWLFEVQASLLAATISLQFDCFRL